MSVGRGLLGMVDLVVLGLLGSVKLDMPTVVGSPLSIGLTVHSGFVNTVITKSV